MARIESLSILTETGDGKAYLAESYGKVVENVQNACISAMLAMLYFFTSTTFSVYLSLISSCNCFKYSCTSLDFKMFVVFLPAVCELYPARFADSVALPSHSPTRYSQNLFCLSVSIYNQLLTSKN